MEKAKEETIKKYWQVWLLENFNFMKVKKQNLNMKSQADDKK